jgi:hypothetical protein
LSAERAVVLVHGHGPKPGAEALLTLWRGALTTGLARDHGAQLSAFEQTELHMVYYADLFPEPHRPSYDAALDLADRRHALDALAALDKPKRFRRAGYDALPGKSAVREFLADLSSPIARGLGLGERALARRMPECEPYWASDGTYAAACQERLRSRLAPLLREGRRVLCVTHGFGAVLAWDVLWALSQDNSLQPEQRLHSWLTLGAPLADDNVRARLAGAQRKGAERYPRSLTFWHNVAAEDDYICHDETVANDFRPMLEQRCVSRIEDHLIYNLAVRFGRSNPHSSLGYLIHPKVSGLLADWLKGAQ